MGIARAKAAAAKSTSAGKSQIHAGMLANPATHPGIFAPSATECTATSLMYQPWTAAASSHPTATDARLMA